MATPTKTHTAEDALRFRECAKMKRDTADFLGSIGDPTGARWERRDAEDMDGLANEILTLPAKPKIGTGGELHLSPAEAKAKPGLACTVEDPDGVTVVASRDRLELASNAGCLAMGADVAETIRARNSLEKMLAHQLSAAHNLAMRLAGRATMHTNNAAHDGFGPVRLEFHAIEAGRAANAAARMMDTFQKGLLALYKLQNGGQQVVTVQHVQISEGGQAVIAGTVKGSSRGRKGGGGDEN